MLSDALALELASYLTPPKLFAQLALLFYVLGFLTRDELILRALVLAGTAFYVIYYFTVTDTPLWEAILGSALIAVANIYSCIIIIRERSTWGMSAEMLALYERFSTLSPGHFRRVMRSSVWENAAEDAPVLSHGAPVEKLYYLRQGKARLGRAGRSSFIGEGQFLGELAFLRGANASADVTICAGAQYIVWNKSDLRRIMDRSPAISNAIVALFNQDLAGKLSVSWPEQQE